ncbi:MAG: helix-turn-helix transcriptional regulator [Bacteroidales bacterium]|nr:helix-turn-helix transcriptional regulator [Bacteroidales bacterium]
MNDTNIHCREYDFTLILAQPSELTDVMVDALFEAGCDDATPSVSYGRVWLEFSRSATSYKEAVLSAIRDVGDAGIGAEVSQVDECRYVTQAETARRIGKSPQYIHQLITGKRGPGRFPPPACHLSEGVLLWSWCEVALWLFQNNIIPQDLYEQAEINHAINTVLTGRSCSFSTLIHEIEMTLTP